MSFTTSYIPALSEPQRRYLQYSYFLRGQPSIESANADTKSMNSITSSPPDITYGATFQIQASLSGAALQGTTYTVISSPGFHTQYVARNDIKPTELTMKQRTGYESTNGDNANRGKRQFS